MWNEKVFCLFEGLSKRRISIKNNLSAFIRAFDISLCIYSLKVRTVELRRSYFGQLKALRWFHRRDFEHPHSTLQRWILIEFWSLWVLREGDTEWVLSIHTTSFDWRVGLFLIWFEYPHFKMNSNMIFMIITEKKAFWQVCLYRIRFEHPHLLFGSTHNSAPKPLLNFHLEKS